MRDLDYTHEDEPERLERGAARMDRHAERAWPGRCDCDECRAGRIVPPRITTRPRADAEAVMARLAAPLARRCRSCGRADCTGETECPGRMAWD